VAPTDTAPTITNNEANGIAAAVGIVAGAGGLFLSGPVFAIGAASAFTASSIAGSVLDSQAQNNPTSSPSTQPDSGGASTGNSAETSAKSSSKTTKNPSENQGGGTNTKNFASLAGTAAGIAIGVRKAMRHAFTAESNISSFLALLLVDDATYEKLNVDTKSQIDKKLEEISNRYSRPLNDTLFHNDTRLLKKAFKDSLTAIIRESSDSSEYLLQQIGKASRMIVGEKDEYGTKLESTLDNLRGILNNIRDDRYLNDEFMNKLVEKLNEASNHNSNQVISSRILDRIGSAKDLSTIINNHLDSNQKEIFLGNIPGLPDNAPEHNILNLSNKLLGLDTEPSHNPTLGEMYTKRFNRDKGSLDPSMMAMAAQDSLPSSLLNTNTSYEDFIDIESQELHRGGETTINNSNAMSTNVIAAAGGTQNRADTVGISSFNFTEERTNDDDYGFLELGGINILVPNDTSQNSDQDSITYDEDEENSFVVDKASDKASDKTSNQNSDQDSDQDSITSDGDDIENSTNRSSSHINGNLDSPTNSNTYEFYRQLYSRSPMSPVKEDLQSPESDTRDHIPEQIQSTPIVLELEYTGIDQSEKGAFQQNTGEFFTFEEIYKDTLKRIESKENPQSPTLKSSTDNISPNKTEEVTTHSPPKSDLGFSYEVFNHEEIIDGDRVAKALFLDSPAEQRNKDRAPNKVNTSFPNPIQKSTVTDNVPLDDKNEDEKLSTSPSASVDQEEKDRVIHSLKLTEVIHQAQEKFTKENIVSPSGGASGPSATKLSPGQSKKPPMFIN